MATVLLITDVSWVENDVRAALTEPDFQVKTHGDPRELVEAVGSAGPDLAIVDMQVGSMGGMALVRSFKDAAIFSEIPDLPIVMLLDRRADAFLAKRAAADSWVVKPFTSHELRSAVERAVTARTQEARGA